VVGTSDHRRHTRDLVLRTGKVVGAPQAAAIECAILNISQSGACILVPVEADIPQHFTLSVDPHDAVYSCETVWKVGPKIGLTFVGSARPE
jgi:hypothetical protein